MPLRRHAEKLEEIYHLYNRPEYISPDPLELVVPWQDPAEAEVVGLVASSLAYGRVEQILKSARWVLDRLGPSPRDAIAGAAAEHLADRLAGFRHRFQTADEMACLLEGAGRVIARAGSLGAAFADCLDRGAGLVDALADWTGRIDPDRRCGHLLADPRRRSACKRLMLYLRWMVRSDAVDPGYWERIDPARLIVPVDTHMHAIAAGLGATARKSADLRTAREITAAFAGICPADPVKYDFALTRWGIRRQMDRNDLLARMMK
ncbi:MAG: TIGR02757 family protein [Phycisphaerae bacterium]